MATSSSFSTDNQYIKYRITTSESNISIANNTSRVRVKVDVWRTNTGYTTYGTGTCYCTINGTKYSEKITTSDKFTHNSHTVVFDKTVTITHGTDGKKTIAISAYIKHQKFNSSSHGFNVKLADIARQANLLTVTNFNDTTNPTITYNNPAGEAVTELTAYLSFMDSGGNADITPRALSKTGSSYTFSLTQAERVKLLQKTPNSNNLSLYCIVKTTIAGNNYFSTLTCTMSVSSATPTITSCSYADINATTTAITGNNQQIIQNNSNVRFTFTGLTAVKYSTLQGISVTVNGVTKSQALSGTTANATIDFGTINVSSNTTAKITLRDSRNNVRIQNLTITMLAWALPNAVITCARRSNFYEETDLNVDGSISSLAGHNTMSLSFRYKENGAQNWSDYITLQDAVTYTATLDNTKAWNIQVLVQDRIGSTTYNLNIDKGIPIVMFDRLKKSVGIEKLPTIDNGLEVYGGINAGGSIVTNGGINASGNITTGGGLNCYWINTRDITSSYIINKTSGAWSIYSQKIIRSGSIVQVDFVLAGDGTTVNAGIDGFVGTIAYGAKPQLYTRLIGMAGQYLILGYIDPSDSSLHFRPVINNYTLASAGRLHFYGIFVV